MMKTKIGTDLTLAKKLLDEGQAVAVPTETVYGLAANALHEDAVLKIYKAKDRPRFNPLIIHLPLWKYVQDYVNDIPDDANLLAAHFSPGPITFLLTKRDLIPDLTTAGSKKVAVRIPAHPLTMQLLKTLDYPVAAPSANPFGYVSPTSAQHVYEGLQGKIPYILDGGESKIGVESTIVDFENGEVIIRRNGGISKEAIEEALEKKATLRVSPTEHPVVPGQLKSHYATITPLYVGDVEELKRKFSNQHVLQLGYGEQEGSEGLNLSEKGDVEEAAKNLFAFLRKADKMGAEVIITSLLPQQGIGAAINDRLLRAQHDVKISSKL